MAESFLLLNCKAEQINKIIPKLEKISQIKEIQRTSGSYDILVKIEAITMNEIDSIITWKIRNIKEVRTTVTLKINSDVENYKIPNEK